MNAKQCGLFVTGTNTEVGKTYVTAMIAQSLRRSGHRVGVYKPAASGCVRDGDELIAEDAVSLWRAAGQPGELRYVCPQRFEAPLAPHLAARAEGRQLDADRLRDGLGYWVERSDIVLVEGAGGLMSPMGDTEYVADLAVDFGYPLIVVAANTLGVINQTLQTLIAACTYGDGLEVAGVVLNDVRPGGEDQSVTSNFDELEKRCVPPVLAHVPWHATEFQRELDWFSFARPA